MHLGRGQDITRGFRDSRNAALRVSDGIAGCSLTYRRSFPNWNSGLWETPLCDWPLLAGTLLLEIKWRVWQAKARNKKRPRIKTGWTRTKFSGSYSFPENPYAQSHLYRLPSLLLLATVICVMFSMPVLCGGKLQRLELTDVFNRSILISDSVRILLLLHHNLPSPHSWIYLFFACSSCVSNLISFRPHDSCRLFLDESARGRARSATLLLHLGSFGLFYYFFV